MSKKVKKYKGKRHPEEVAVKEKRSVKSMIVPLAISFIVVLVIIAGIIYYVNRLYDNEVIFNTKINKIENLAITDEIKETLGENPAGDIGNAVFISICNSMEKAIVFRATGDTLDSAFNQVKQFVIDFLHMNKKFDPYWVKLDIVKVCEEVNGAGVSELIKECSSGYNIAGLSFDEEFKSALLPQEIDSGELFDYENDEISIENLNILLGKEKEEYIEELPELFYTFSCLSWLCDDKSFVKELSSEYPSYGRRDMSATDEVTIGMSAWAVNYMQEFIGDDGKFIHNYYPTLGYEHPDYSNDDHAGAVWTLLEFYKSQKSEKLKHKIDLAIDYLLSTIVYDGDKAYAVNSDEITADTTSLYITALVEYMRVFETEEYIDVCKQLGNGILNLVDTDKFSYTKSLNSDLSENKIETGFEDAKALLGLVKLASYSGDTKYSEPVDKALAHLVNEQYVEKADPWLSQVLLDVVIYTNADENLCTFALANAQNNLETISGRYGTNPQDLELLLCAYKSYLVAKANGTNIDGFNEYSLVQTIRLQVEKIFDGYFYPEYAMYMQNPRMVIGSFFERGNRFRVSIANQYHNVLALLSYTDCYESLVSAGLDSDSLVVEQKESSSSDSNAFGIEGAKAIELNDENSYYDENGRLIVKFEDGSEVVVYDPAGDIPLEDEGSSSSSDSGDSSISSESSDS